MTYNFTWENQDTRYFELWEPNATTLFGRLLNCWYERDYHEPSRTV